jgi:PleD family two-component response regulator
LASAPVDDEHGAEWFIARADEALYQSKQLGRNRVTLARLKNP